MEHYSKCCLYFSLFACLFFIPTLGQTDPNPNSSTPVLLSEIDSSRALAIVANSNIEGVPKSQKKVFKLNSTIILYVADIELIEGEDANAFRIFAEDSNNTKFRFPVISIDQVSKKKPIYALTVELRNENGNWNQPMDTGDVLVTVTWRGLASNSLLLGIGKTGGFKYENKSVNDFIKNAKIPTSDYVGYRWSGDRKRFLEQATFGSTDALDQRIRRIGLRVWINEQFNTPYPSPSNPYPNLELRSSLQDLGCPNYLPADEKRVCDRDYYSLYPVQNWFFKEALYGDAQLRHRVAWALSQIWVTSGDGTQQARHMIEYHKVLSRNTFGNYRDLMYEMTLNPTMGNYLDMVRSNAFSPNENYAREILQLFSIGLYMLNQDGTLMLDANNRPIPTYTQEEVNNFTKIFTGWTYCYDGNNPTCPNAAPGIVNFIDPMFLEEGGHNVHTKTLLNYPNAVNRNISANQNPYDDLNQALNNIFHHPNVAPFIGKILIQHLVTSDPTPAYVTRVSAAFNNNGFGVRGDMKTVVKAILLDPEARGDFKTDPNYGKLREPVQFITNVLRNFNVRSANGIQKSDGVISNFADKMGQNPFYANSVFNYYPPGYTIPGTTHNAPEFWIMTTSTSVARINFSDEIALKRITVGQDIPLGTSLDFSHLSQLAQSDTSGVLLVNELNRKLMNSRMSTNMRNLILTACSAIPIFAPEFRTRTALFLIISSTEYQIQR